MTGQPTTIKELAERMDLLGERRRVLVIEDHLPWLARLSEFWTEAGHEVIAMAGVAEIEGNIASGPGLDLTETVRMDLRNVDAAFLDHYFLSKQYDGKAMVIELMRRGLPKICGMSSDARANQSMRAFGAILAFRKAELMRLFA